LLFPYGERGFQIGVLYNGAMPARKNAHSKVDARAAIDESRLWYILDNQSDLRVENIQGISDAVDRGCVDGTQMGKMTVLPSSFMGGWRYMIQNYHDAIAICRVHGPPDFFVTFTCNAKWPEIAEGIIEPGHKPSDRADIIVRVFNMKLEDLLHDIKSGKAFGPCSACTNIRPILSSCVLAHLLYCFCSHHKFTCLLLDYH